MKHFRTLMLTLAALSISACAGPQAATRNVTLTDGSHKAALAQPAGASNFGSEHVYIPDLKIAKVTVDVPQSLVVSEKNSYYPKGDIVWRGDAFGDRHAQVQAIVEDSAAQTASKLRGTRPVHMHIQVTRFHGLSEKARYSTGGVHNINFLVTLLDPTTGAVLRPAREVVSNLDAFGGAQAIQADQRGETQKARVTSFISQVIEAELTQPKGYQDTNSGLFVVLNRN